jgi:hypothetical protein
MNMPIQREARKVRIHPRDLEQFEPPIILSDSAPSEPKNIFKYALFGCAAVGAAFGITTLSATTLWLLGAIVAAVIGILTAVCIYALNHESL